MSKPIENNKKKYMEYVQKKLKKYKVNDPSKVPNKHKKKFFKELDTGWESKEEKGKKRKKKADMVQSVLEMHREAVNKKAPKQPPKGWWEKMQNTIKNKNPDMSDGAVAKIVGGIWYNRMSPAKKKEVTKEFES